jgi:UDP-sugar pyrophosphorylase
VEAVNKGSKAPGTMSSAESDIYIQNQRKLKFAGVEIPVTDADSEENMISISNIPVTAGPRVILCPSFGITQQEILDKIKGDSINISRRSSLVLAGHHLTIQNLDLDGALVIRAGDETHVTVDGLKVRNKGWELVENDPTKEYAETVAIRGYTMEKHETAEFILNEPGSFVIGEDRQVKKID